MRDAQAPRAVRGEAVTAQPEGAKEEVVEPTREFC